MGSGSAPTAARSNAEPCPKAGLPQLLAEKGRIAEPRVKSGSANPSPKLATVIAGMCVGADSIDDLDVVRSLAGDHPRREEPGVGGDYPEAADQGPGSLPGNVATLLSGPGGRGVEPESLSRRSLIPSRINSRPKSNVFSRGTGAWWVAVTGNLAGSAARNAAPNCAVVALQMPSSERKSKKSPPSM